MWAGIAVQFGKLEFFETALAFIAGYGLKAFLIAQSLNQLEKAYGPNNSILDNCHIRFTYAANDDKTARRISDLLGQATEKKMQKSYSGSGLFLTHRSVSEQEYARPLLTPAEVNQLSQDDGILLVGGLLPYRARKVRYYLDPRFRGRDGLPTPDSPEAQARELPARTPSDWEGLLITPAPEEASKARDDEPAPKDAAPSITANVPTDAKASLPSAEHPAGTAATASVWDGFFDASGSDVDSDPKEDSDSSGELPL